MARRSIRSRIAQPPAEFAVRSTVCGIVIVIATFTACSKPKVEPLAQPVEAVSACDRKLITANDVAAIIGAPITGSRDIAGDAQSCEFETASFPSITITVRPGRGRATLESWSTGKMPLAATPLAGIGDSAVWQTTLHELIAQRGDLLCDIQVSGPNKTFAASEAALQKKLGELCVKVFDHY